MGNGSGIDREGKIDDSRRVITREELENRARGLVADIHEKSIRISNATGHEDEWKQFLIEGRSGFRTWLEGQVVQLVGDVRKLVGLWDVWETCEIERGNDSESRRETTEKGNEG